MLEVRGAAKLRLRLLGGAVLDSDSGLVRISSQKGLALLAYLAMHPGRSLSRSVLADLLWGDRGDAAARQNLRQSIHTLRRDLGPMHASALLADEQSILLAAEAVEVDALEFIARAQDPEPASRARCLDIPWGSFLDKVILNSEPFDAWVVAERHRLDAIATRTFSDLAASLDASGDGDRAITALERLIAIDPGEEERHRRLLLLEARYRGPDAALARAKELAALLRRELDLEPEPATAALIADIRQKAGETRSADIAGLAAPVLPPSVGATDRQPTRLSVRSLAVLATVVVIAGGAALVWGLKGQAPVEKAAERPAIAASQASDSWKPPPLPSATKAGGIDQQKGIIPLLVLPIETYGEAGPIRLLADMMTDDVINMLSRVQAFRVISRQTARAYQKQSIDLVAIGAELGVRYVLEGRMRMHGDKLRVTVELTDTATRQVAWSARVEREDSDRHTVQDEIVGRLVRELHMGSFPIESARLSKDADADALAFRGAAAMQAAFSNINLEAYEKARVLFVQALERDPQHVRARLGLGAYHLNIAVQRLVADHNSHLDTAYDLVMGVTKQYPELFAGHHQLGIILQTRGKLTEAIEAFQRAVEINPSSAGSYAHIGFALARMRRAEEGLEHIRYAMRLSPKDPAFAIWLEFAGAAELELDRHENAIENFRRSIALTPSYPRPWAGLTAAQALAGDIEGARVSADKLRSLAPKLTAEELFRRFGRLSSESPRLREGLRLALDLPSKHSH